LHLRSQLGQILDSYFTYFLSVGSLRIWDKANPDLHYDKLESYLSNFHPIVRETATLLRMAIANVGFNDAYVTILERIDELNAEHRRAFHRIDTLTTGGHLNKAYLSRRRNYLPILRAYQDQGAGRRVSDAELTDQNHEEFQFTRRGNHVDFARDLHQLSSQLEELGELRVAFEMRHQDQELKARIDILSAEILTTMLSDEEAFTSQNRHIILENTLRRTSEADQRIQRYNENYEKQREFLHQRSLEIELEDLPIGRLFDYVSRLYELIAYVHLVDESVSSDHPEEHSLENLFSVTTNASDRTATNAFAENMVRREDDLLEIPIWRVDNIVYEDRGFIVVDPAFYQPFYRRLQENLSARSEARKAISLDEDVTVVNREDVQNLQGKYVVPVDMDVFDALEAEQQEEFYKAIKMYSEDERVKFVFMVDVSGDRQPTNAYLTVQALVNDPKYKNVRIENITSTSAGLLLLDASEIRGRKILSITKDGVKGIQAERLKKELEDPHELIWLKYLLDSKGAGLLMSAIKLLDSGREDLVRLEGGFTDVNIPASLRSKIRSILMTYEYVGLSA